MHYLILFILLASPLLSHSLTITDHNLTVKASNHDVTTTLVEIWGATTGTCDTSFTTDSNSNVNTCNTCLDNTDKEAPCNPKQINKESEISISFTFSDDISNSTAYIKDSEGNVVTNLTSTVANGVATVEVKWTNLCLEMPTASDSECNSFDAGDFTLGITDSTDTDKSDTLAMKIYSIPINATTGTVSPDCNSDPVGSSNVGILDFSAFPGDEKIFFPGSEDADRITPILTFCSGTGTSSGSAPTGGEINNLVAFYSTTDLASINTASSNQEISFVGTFPDVEINEPYIDGFENDQAVFTRLAVQDNAGNIYDLSPTNAQITALGGTCVGINNGSSDTDLLTCKYSSIAMDVNGLLNEDLNCFIATATFGSSMYFLVKDLRSFRNKFLLKNEIGQKLVKTYYKWGSKASHYIHDSPALKALAQIALFPIWLFAWLSLKVGLLITTILLFISFMTIVYYIRALVHKKRTV